MTSLHTSRPTLPFTYTQWIQQTSRTLHPRSAELRALDILVDAYGRTPSENNLRFLKNAFRHWRDAQGEGDAWIDSSRNDKKMLPFVALNAALFKDGDKDTSLGVPSFMRDDLVSTRLGLVYLFSHLECRADYFSMVTNGVLDLSGSGMDFAGEQAGEAVKTTLGQVKAGIDFARPGVESVAESADKRFGRGARASLPSGSIGVGPDDVEAQRVVDGAKLLKLKGGNLTPTQKTLSNTIHAQLKRTWESTVGYWDEYAGTYLRQLCDFLTGRYLTEAVTGAIGGSFGAAGSLLKLIESSFERYRIWAGGKKTAFLVGTPTAIVDGIKDAMDLAVGRDVYQTLKKGAQLGMQIASVGASTIVNLVTSVLEILIKAAWKIHETRRFRAFLADAKNKWLQRDTEQLHARPLAFNAWFRGHASGLPIVSALALNSNICHNMHFLQLFPSGKDLITQSQYDAGMAQMGLLKDFSSRYVEESGYALSSEDGLVEEWIKPGLRAEGSGWRRHVLNPIGAFLG